MVWNYFSQSITNPSRRINSYEFQIFSHIFPMRYVFKYFELLAERRKIRKVEGVRDWIWQNFVFHPVRSFGSGSKWRAHLHHFVWRLSLNSPGEPVYPSPLSSLVSAKRPTIAESREFSSLDWETFSPSLKEISKRFFFLRIFEHQYSHKRYIFIDLSIDKSRQ